MALPEFDPRLDRVVKIKVRGADDREALVGTGFLLAPGLVITARHVVQHSGSASGDENALARVRVRAATGTGASCPVVEWVPLGGAGGVDVAALIVPGLDPVVGTVVVGARLRDGRPLPGCSMIGFPRAAHDGSTVGAEYVGVTALPISGAAVGKLAAEVTTPPPTDVHDWRGLSGAGVVDSTGHLLGLANAVQLNWRERLAVVPIEGIVAAARASVGTHPALAPLADLAVVEESGKEPLFDPGKFPPRLADLRYESLFDILHFTHRVVPFVADGPREEQLNCTIDWAQTVAERPDIRVGVISGPAGMGKSRLAAEVCDRLTAAHPWWRAGFVDHDKLHNGPVPNLPTLLVCDYPERSPEAIGDFLARVWEQRRAGLLRAPVRVLLVSRFRASWYERVAARVRNLDKLIDHQIELTPGRFDAEIQLQHAKRAFEAYCEGFQIPVDRRSSYAADRIAFDRPLLVHIDALLNALPNPLPATTSDAPNESPRLVERYRLLDHLIDNEVHRLQRIQIDDGSGRQTPAFASSAEVREALCVTTLSAPFRKHLPDLLACTEAFGPNGNHNRVRPADALLWAFPSDRSEPGSFDPFLRRIAPVEPDLIAAHLLDRTPGRSGIVKRLVASNVVSEEPAYHAQLISILALAAEDYPIVADDLKNHLASSLSALIDAGETTAASLAELLADRLTALVRAASARAAENDFSASRQLATALRLPGSSSDHRIDEAAAKLLGGDLPPSQLRATTGLELALSLAAIRNWNRRLDLADARDEYPASQLKIGLELVGRYWGKFESAEFHTSATILESRLASMGLAHAIETGDQSEILRWVERARVPGLRIQSAMSSADPTVRISIDRLRVTRQRLLERREDGSDAHAVDERIRRVEARIRSFGRTVLGSGEQPEHISPEMIHELARERESVVVDLFEAGDRLHAILAGGDEPRHVDLMDLDTAVVVARRLEADIDALGIPFVLPERLRLSIESSLRRNAQVLSAGIWDPITEIIGDGQIVIIPHREFARVPWSLLPVLRGRPVSIAPSAELWWRAAKRPKATGPGLVAAGMHLVTSGSGLDYIAGCHPGCNYFIADGSDPRLILKSLDGASVAHLATHGQRAVDVLFSSFVFDRGPLYLFELLSLDQPPSHIALSFSDLGHSTITAQPELLGFAGALLHVGASSVLASLGRVSEEMAASMMREYHRRLGAGATPAEALAATGEHYTWHPYICFGA
jgi:hypothetical protein